MLFNQRSSVAVNAELKTSMVQPLRCCLGMLPLPSKYRVYVLSRILHCQVNPRHPALFWQKALLESIPMPPLFSLVLSIQLCTSERGFHSYKLIVMLVYSKSVATVNCVMLVKASANTIHYSVELLPLIIIAHAELWVGVYKGKRRLL